MKILSPIDKTYKGGKIELIGYDEIYNYGGNLWIYQLLQKI